MLALVPVLTTPFVCSSGHFLLRLSSLKRRWNSRETRLSKYFHWGTNDRRMSIFAWQLARLYFLNLFLFLSSALRAEQVGEEGGGLIWATPRSRGSKVSSREVSTGRHGGAGTPACTRAHLGCVLIVNCFRVWVGACHPAGAGMREIFRCASAAVLVVKTHTSCYTWSRCMCDSSVAWWKENIPHSPPDGYKNQSPERRLIRIIFVGNVCVIIYSSVCFHRFQKNRSM